MSTLLRLDEGADHEEHPSSTVPSAVAAASHQPHMPPASAGSGMRCYEPDFTVLSNDIGRGNFSTISLARRVREKQPKTDAAAQDDTSCCSPVAIKVCRRDNHEHLRVLQREWQAHSCLRPSASSKPAPPGSEHIIRALHFFENADEAAIVMEYAPYSDLMHFVQARHFASSGSSSGLFPAEATTAPLLSEHDYRTVVGTVCRALDALHAAGFAHRDVKPHNILVVSQSPLVVKLGDLGLVKKVGQSNLWMERNASGDLSIMCAEARQRAKDGVPMRRKDYFKADVYAVGVTLFYLIEGSLPTEVDVMLVSMPEAAAHRWPHVSDACRDLLRSLLHTDPDARPLPREVLAHPWFADDAMAASALVAGVICSAAAASATKSDTATTLAQSPTSPQTPSRLYRRIGESEFTKAACLMDPSPQDRHGTSPMRPSYVGDSVDDNKSMR